MKNTIKGWVARDSDGRLLFYTDKPWKYEGKSWAVPEGEWMEIDKSWYPDVKWEDDEPKRVEMSLAIIPTGKWNPKFEAGDYFTYKCEDWRVMMVDVDAEAATIKNDGYFCRRLDDKEDKQDTWFPKDMEKDMEPHAEECEEEKDEWVPEFTIGDIIKFKPTDTHYKIVDIHYDGEDNTNGDFYVCQRIEFYNPDDDGKAGPNAVFHRENEINMELVRWNPKFKVGDIVKNPTTEERFKIFSPDAYRYYYVKAVDENNREIQPGVLGFKKEDWLRLVCRAEDVEEEVNEFPKDGFPKFKVGDKVMFRGEKITINDITNTGYEVMYPEGEGFIGGGLENEMEKVKTKFDESELTHGKVVKTEEAPDDRAYCKEHCKGYRESGGKCYFGFNCSVKKEAEAEKKKWIPKFKEGDYITDMNTIYIVRQVYEGGYWCAICDDDCNPKTEVWCDSREEKNFKLYKREPEEKQTIEISSTKEAEEIINFIKDCFDKLKQNFHGYCVDIDWKYYEAALEVLRPEYSSYQQGFNAGYSKGYEARIRVEKDIVIGLKEVLDEVNKIKDEDDC